MVCINIHTDSTNLSIKNKDLARSAPSIPLPLPHLLIVLMAQGAPVGGRRDKQQQNVNAKGGCSSPFTRIQIKALESLGLITYNDVLLCVDINKASQLANLMYVITGYKEIETMQRLSISFSSDFFQQYTPLGWVPSLQHPNKNLM